MIKKLFYFLTFIISMHAMQPDFNQICMEKLAAYPDIVTESVLSKAFWGEDIQSYKRGEIVIAQDFAHFSYYYACVYGFAPGSQEPLFILIKKDGTKKIIRKPYVAKIPQVVDFYDLTIQ